MKVDDDRLIADLRKEDARTRYGRTAHLAAERITTAKERGRVAEERLAGIRAKVEAMMANGFTVNGRHRLEYDALGRAVLDSILDLLTADPPAKLAFDEADVEAVALAMAKEDPFVFEMVSSDEACDLARAALTAYITNKNRK